MIAVEFQNGLSPIALTIDATHEGPEPSVEPAWSDAFGRRRDPRHVCEVAVGNVAEHLRRRRYDVRLVLGAILPNVPDRVEPVPQAGAGLLLIVVPAEFPLVDEVGQRRCGRSTERRRNLLGRWRR